MRVHQIEERYEELEDDEKALFDEAADSSLNMDVSDWIVVAVTFRSNDPNEESSVRRFLQSQTTETLKTKAFLSTERFRQIELQAYFPPRDDSVGAKFVFPRAVKGSPMVAEEGGHVTFEFLDVPGAEPYLRSIFSVSDMVVDGELIL